MEGERMSSWQYMVGRYNGKIRLAEVTIPDDKRRSVWGHPVSWGDLFLSPRMVLRDLLWQKKYLGKMVDLERLEKSMKRYFTKVIKQETKPL